jgi:rhomboid protease GluP
MPPGPPPAPPPASPPPPLLERFKTAFDESPVTVGLVVLTVAVWIVHMALQRWGGTNTDLTLQDPGTAIHGDWWRLFTPMVVHYGIAHIGFNMLALWVLGRPVEKVVGQATFLASYVACGVAGQVASDIYYGVGTASGGASGAIFGLIGVLIGNFLVTERLQQWGRVSSQRWHFTRQAAKSLGIQAGVWLVLGGVITRLDTAAHAGGIALGVVLGAAIGYRRSSPGTPS